VSGTMDDADRIAVVRRMLAAWDAMDWDGIVALFAEDGVLHSVMQEPVVGRAAIATRMAALADGCTHVDLQVRSIGVIDHRVFVERRDVFDRQGRHGEVPVVGVLSVEDGLVTEWLEYYDRATLEAGLA
jgi:limonene-1,2-epoxide hydrolase